MLLAGKLLQAIAQPLVQPEVRLAGIVLPQLKMNVRLQGLSLDWLSG